MMFSPVFIRLTVACMALMIEPLAYSAHISTKKSSAATEARGTETPEILDNKGANNADAKIGGVGSPSDPSPDSSGPLPGLNPLVYATPVSPPVIAPKSDVSAPAIGWGNMLVPGLGATLRGQPGRGLGEAGLELGLFFGGTFGVHEHNYGIDGSITVPNSGNLYTPTTGEVLQQFGLKIHLYDTFYHYQEAAIEQQGTDREKNNPQKIYRGDWLDTLSAPFEWKNLSSPWTWPVLLSGTAYLLIDYRNSTVQRSQIHSTSTAETYFGLGQAVIIPLGSEFGEDVFFRGFLQRELGRTTGSQALAVGLQSALFAAGHTDKLNAFIVGAYFGVMVDALGGDLGPSMASHFWLDVVSGLINYWQVIRSEAKPTPFNPPLAAQIKIPFG